NFMPGETIEKQIIVINNSRESVTCEASWSFGLLQPVTDTIQVTIATGDQARIPLRIELPQTLAAGSYEIRLQAKFGAGETQEDRFVVDVLPKAALATIKLPLTPSLSSSGGEGAVRAAEGSLP